MIVCNALKSVVPQVDCYTIPVLVDVSDILYFFSVRGRGTGRGGGSVFLLKIPGGGCLRGERGGDRGAGRVSVGIWGGGGLNIFFSAEIPTKLSNFAIQGPISLGSPSKTLGPRLD